MTSLSSDRALLASTVALLAQGRHLDRLSCGLTIVGVAALFALSVSDPKAAATFLIILSVLAGLAELYLAVRVGFDAALFRELMQSAACDVPDFVGLDSALLRLGLIPPTKTNRPLDRRARGACRLFYAQAVSLALQVAFAVAGAAMAAVR